MVELVSKWDEEMLAKHPTAERVDVIMDLADAFEPNTRRRRSAIETQKQESARLSEAENIKDYNDDLR